MNRSVAIEKGKVMDTLKQLPGIDPKLFKRTARAVERTNLPLDAAVEAILQSGHLVEELFLAAEVGAKAINEEDKKFISMVELLTPEEKDATINLIRKLQDAWWVELLDATPLERLMELSRRNFIDVNKSPDKAAKYPILASMSPFTKKNSFSTDLIGPLCNEIDISIQFLMVLGDRVPYYSRVKGVDSIYMEYKLLQEKNRIIINSFVSALNKRNTEVCEH